MFCPYCGAFNSDGSAQCAVCHGRFHTPAPAETPAVRKGRLWPALVALAVMLAIGVGLFFGIRLTPTVQTDPTMPWFSIEDGTLYFDKSLYTGGQTLVIPQTVAGQRVRQISEYCFQGCDSFSAVELPEGLEWIGTKAFAGCSYLRGVRFPETLQGIGDHAFAGCTALEALAVPFNLQTFGTGAFDDCDSLRYVYYVATMELWQQLQIDSIGPNTWIFCVDGTLQGG